MRTDSARCTSPWSSGVVVGASAISSEELISDWYADSPRALAAAAARASAASRMNCEALIPACSASSATVSHRSRLKRTVVTFMAVDGVIWVT